jgi:excinuclease UvrABC ATPase subunit
VEHDLDLIRIADHVVDMGPDAGAAGGEIVFEGTLEGLRHANSPTGEYLRRKPRLKTAVRPASRLLAAVRDATLHNLASVDVDIPAGVLCVLAGVAGSGKSSLLSCLLNACPDIHVIDQRGVRGGRRSTPVTWLDALDPLRRAFATANGVGIEWFSPSSVGACPVCRGVGVITTEPPLWTT